MSAFFLGPVLLLVIGVVIVLPIVLIAILLGRRRPPASSAAPPAPNENPAARNQRREEILGRLARKEISRDEAERQLVELDNPVPAQMPATPPPPRNGCGSGCLVAVICGMVAFVLLLLLLGSFFLHRNRTFHQSRSIQMEMYQ